jgi:glycosyltransferase involved in cell wall biosynthesis
MQLPISLVVTCKNRLDHLKQTLPSFLELPLANIIVVDYGCMQGTAQWVNSLEMGLIVEKVDDDPFFCLARARNAALKRVSTEYIIFVDADVKLKPGLGVWLNEHLQKHRTFWIAQRPCNHSLYGTLICNTKDFNRVGQYDEAYRAWGGEDADLYTRFQRSGLKVSYFPSQFMEPIDHDDDIRCLQLDGGGMGSKSRAIILAKIYREIKLDIEAVIVDRLEIDFRHQLMSDIRHLLLKMFAENIKVESLQINLPALLHSPIAKKTMNYEINIH